MACPRKKSGLGLMCLTFLAVLIQGCFCDEDDLVPNEFSVPQKLEQGEKGTVHYNVDTVKLTGSKHVKMDGNKNEGPPWPPRPGRRNIIPLKSKKALPTVIRPGRSIIESLMSKGKRNFQVRLLRPGRDAVPKRPPYELYRPGREDVPQPQLLLRPGRDAIPQLLLRPGREMAGPPPLLRPGKELVPMRSRDEIPEQYHTVRAGKRSLGYNMPWTYEGRTVNSNVRHNTHTFRQKALEETTKRNFQDNEQEMSDPNSLEDVQQDF